MLVKFKNDVPESPFKKGDQKEVNWRTGLALVREGLAIRVVKKVTAKKASK